MGRDVVAYTALHKARLAGARAVHLHPTQLTPAVVATVRAGGVEIHMWDANDPAALQTAVDLAIPQVCTDWFQQAVAFRQALEPTPNP